MGDSGRLAALREHRVVQRIRANVVGRVLVGVAEESVRVEIFDRSMTIAAQFFTSLLPLFIVTASLLEGDDSQAVSDLFGASGPSSELIDDAVAGAGDAAFGVVGALFVLGSATSLSRALTRAFAAVWQVARPRLGLGSAWRWLAVVVAFLLAVVVSQNLGPRVGLLPPRQVWPVALTVATDAAVAVFVPWMLLSGVVRARVLLPGAAGFAALMAAIRPAADVWLPWALQTSSDRYGPIGMAFTYLAWLYVVAFVLLGSAVVGHVLVSPLAHDVAPLAPGDDGP